MEMNTRNVNDVKVVNLNGELDTTTAPDLEAHLKDLQDGGAGKILLNLEKLEYTSSAGLRVFLVTAKQLRASGGSFAVCCLNEIVQEIFDISGFASILNVSANEEEALKVF